MEEKQLPMFGYVMVKAPLAGRSTFDGLLKLYTRAKEPAVIEAAFVQGPHDLVVKVAAGTKLEFDDFVMSVIQAIPAVQYTRTYISANSPRYLCWLREKQTESGQPLSWVLLKVPSLQSGGVVVCAEKIEGVVEAASVYGDWDVILKVQGEHLDESISQVRKIPYVSDTMTMRVEQDKEKPHLAAKRFAWSREFFLT